MECMYAQRMGKRIRKMWSKIQNVVRRTSKVDILLSVWFTVPLVKDYNFLLSVKLYNCSNVSVLSMSCSVVQLHFCGIPVTAMSLIWMLILEIRRTLMKLKERIHNWVTVGCCLSLQALPWHNTTLHRLYCVGASNIPLTFNLYSVLCCHR
jgi:hypothetical protein